MGATDLGFLIPICAVLFVFTLGTLWFLFQYRYAKKFGGTTRRQFQSAGDVWGILDLWAGMKNYEMVAQDQDSRTYLKTGASFYFLDPRVTVSRTNAGYQLDACLFTQKGSAAAIMWVLPREILLEADGLWWAKSDQQITAIQDVNALIGKLDSRIDQIPYEPLASVSG